MRVGAGRLVLFLFLALTAGPAAGQFRPPGYAEAENAFSALPLNNRLILQALMTGAGYFDAVPTEKFSVRLFEAIKQFQTENGLPQTGSLDAEQFGRLISAAAPMFDLWGLQKISHPFRRYAIWAPVGLGLIATRNEYGIAWDDPKKRIRLDFTTVPNLPIERNFEAIDATLTRGRANIHYSVLKKNWFAISFTTADGADGYMRYHQDGSFVTGFTLVWNKANGNVGGERLATLMSGSLSSAMTGSPFPDPPERNSKPEARPSSQATVAPAPTDPAPEQKREAEFSSGTGFFVSHDGGFVTNDHVIGRCSVVKVKTDDGAVSDARILARDTTNDLAVLRLNKTPKKIASLRIGVRLGEGIATFGYPYIDILSKSGNFTLGNVTAVSGIGDDSRYVQISAPVQSGNSGGPLLDLNGNVVGMVTGKLNALKIAVRAGDLPQNVNFAVKSAILATFLDANSIGMISGATAPKPLDPADLAEQAKAISGFVVCKRS